MKQAQDITGLKFNRLTAIKFAYAKNNVHFWHFQCECGEKIIARKGAVTSGQHKSCGCLHKEKVSQKKYNKFILKDDCAIMIVKRLDENIEVLLDIEDVERVKSLGAWQALVDTTLQKTSYYIIHRKAPYVRLHRYIMNCPDNMVIDHINHNTLDNRKANLRICTTFENQQNLRSKLTEQTGVYLRTTRNIWVANITMNNKRYYKEFKTKEEAITQRKKWEKAFYNKGGDE